jgi:NAD(P)-dependent dehydrogenase (short-subunit alcohol dehydrogenase family)
VSRNGFDSFDLTGRTAVITGGAGLLGVQHARAIAAAGGIPILVDIRGDEAAAKAQDIAAEFSVAAAAVEADITSASDVTRLTDSVLADYGRIDILINNAANDSKVSKDGGQNLSRLESFPVDQWNRDIAVGLTGAFLCSQAFGARMAAAGRGVIVNIASDLALIGPDQRIYRKDGLPDDQQDAKAISYSVVKSALIGMTRYLATYWAAVGVRVNSISPGGVFTDQPDEFLGKLTNLIPLGRMAKADEYRGAILFLCSDASSYMTGANLVVDGGRTAW